MSASNKARAFANREKQAQSERNDRLGRALLLGAATLLTFATISLLAADRLYRPDTFVIDRLKIKGISVFVDRRPRAQIARASCDLSHTFTGPSLGENESTNFPKSSL